MCALCACRRYGILDELDGESEVFVGSLAVPRSRQVSLDELHPGSDRDSDGEPADATRAADTVAVHSIGRQIGVDSSGAAMLMALELQRIAAGGGGGGVGGSAAAARLDALSLYKTQLPAAKSRYNRSRIGSGGSRCAHCLRHF